MCCLLGGWRIIGGSGTSQIWELYLGDGVGWLCKPKIKCWLRARPCWRGLGMEASPGWAGEDDVRM